MGIINLGQYQPWTISTLDTHNLVDATLDTHNLGILLAHDAPSADSRQPIATPSYAHGLSTCTSRFARWRWHLSLRVAWRAAGGGRFSAVTMPCRVAAKTGSGSLNPFGPKTGSVTRPWGTQPWITQPWTPIPEEFSDPTTRPP